jgi:hypothetical protein
LLSGRIGIKDLAYSGMTAKLADPYADSHKVEQRSLEEKLFSKLKQLGVLAYCKI